MYLGAVTKVTMVTRKVVAFGYEGDHGNGVRFLVKANRQHRYQIRLFSCRYHTIKLTYFWLRR